LSDHEIPKHGPKRDPGAPRLPASGATSTVSPINLGLQAPARENLWVSGKAATAARTPSFSAV
jgi:hypothetical protein